MEYDLKWEDSEYYYDNVPVEKLNKVAIKKIMDEKSRDGWESAYPIVHQDGSGRRTLVFRKAKVK